MSNPKEKKEQTTTYNVVNLETLARAWADPRNRESVQGAFKKAKLGSDAREYLDRLLNRVTMAAELINESAKHTSQHEQTMKMLQGNPELAKRMEGFLKEIATPDLDGYERKANRDYINVIKKLDVLGRFTNVQGLAILIGDKESGTPRAYLMSGVDGRPADNTLAKVDLSPFLSMTFPK